MPRYIEGLNECTNPAASDWLWAVDSSAPETDKDRKVAVGKLAVLALEQTFAALQTFAQGIAIGAANVKLWRPTQGVLRQASEYVTLAPAAVLVLRDDSGYALVDVLSGTHGRYATFAIEGNGNGRLIHGDSTLFKTTGNTQIMVFALSNVVYLQNFTGATLIVATRVWA